MKKNKQVYSPDILVVDDTPLHIEALSFVLMQNHFNVRVALTGQTALKLLEQQPADLILLDVYMPEMDGFSLCQKIKSDTRFRHIPIIFLTSSNDENSIRRGFELGAQDYVVKPFNASELLARVNTHIKLKQQAQHLREANRELDSFCYTVSHDLKAPLLSINKLVEYLETDYKDRLPSDGQELLLTIREKSNEVISIVNRLLEFSKMCEMQIKKEKLSLTKIFHEVYNELLSYESKRQVQFTLKYLPDIHCDALMIRLLVTNILSNALKYTRHKEIADIGVEFTENDNHYIITVKDNGAGFDMRYSSRLFGVFQRLHSQNEFEGSGVGLAICQRILKRHNGKAWMTGEVGKGANFYFSLPKSPCIRVDILSGNLLDEFS